MPEAIIIILDNSNYSINGDYPPTRWIAQLEAAGLLIQTKMETNQQTAIGLALSAGSQVEIICTPTTDQTKVNSFLYGIKQSGLMKLSIVSTSLSRHCRQ